MLMPSDYRIYVGDTPGPTLRLVIETGKLIVEFAPEVAGKLQELVERPPDEDGRKKVVRLYGEYVGRVYDGFRMAALAPSTATVYSRYIGKLFDWMDDKGITKPIGEVEEEFTEYLIASRQSFRDPDGLSVRRLVHFAFQKFLELCIDEDAASAVNPPPVPEPKPATSEEDLLSLFDHVRSICDILMLIVMNVLHISTGAAANLTWDDFGPNFETVTVGEGEDAVEQEIDPDYREFFAELKSRARSPYVLADTGGDLPAPVPVTDRSLQYRFRRLARRSGIIKRITLTSTRKAEAIASDLLMRIMEKYLPTFDQQHKSAGNAAG